MDILTYDCVLRVILAGSGFTDHYGMCIHRIIIEGYIRSVGVVYMASAL
jgi:hypothetical protein